MSWSVSVSTAGMSKAEKDEAFDLLTQISLAHQDAMAQYYFEQEELRDHEQKKKKRLEEKKQREKAEREQAEAAREKALQEEKEMLERIKKREKSINWGKKR
jgi:hypothetical protein